VDGVWWLASREMVQILQEYGGVVCCFGSSASAENTAIFLQADCRSIHSSVHVNTVDLFMTVQDLQFANHTAAEGVVNDCHSK